VYLTLFLLRVQGSSPTLAGLEVAPFAVASLVVSLLAARVVARLGLRISLVGGLALCGVGLALMLDLPPESVGLRLLPALLIFGIGAGIVNPTMTVAALSTVDAAHSGMASGINNTARQLGIAAGIAALGAVLESRLADGTGAQLTAGGVRGPQAGAAAQLAASGDMAGAAASLGRDAGALVPAYTTSFTHALTVVFLVGIGVIAFGVLVAVTLIRPAATPATAPTRTRAFVVAGDADGRPTDATCTHLEQVSADVPPSTEQGCADCLREGATWVHLRKCLRCGHIGCCDSSPHRHAAQHWHASSHPLVQSAQPGEEWAWCYPDELLLAPEH
jgi:hypothetical protein